MRFGNLLRGSAFLLCAAVFGGCDSGGDEPTGTVSMSLMDRSVDGVTELYVTISEMWIKPRGDGPAFQLKMTSESITVDLLELNDENASVLVDEAVVRAGSYNWVEMKVEDTDITESHAMTTDGRMVPMNIDVPSNRIRLVGGFEVGENQGIRFLFDWDVRKGLTEAVGRDVYLLRPAFRVLTDYGSVSGTDRSAARYRRTRCCRRTQTVTGTESILPWAKWSTFLMATSHRATLAQMGRSWLPPSMPLSTKR
jgi:hypothetical protein